MIILMSKRRYFLYNLLKGFIWLAVFLIVFILFKRYVKIDFLASLEPLFGNKYLMFLIFLLSEVFIGIIPPEIFIIWALRFDGQTQFFIVIALLAVISYMAGLSGYFIGRYLNSTLYYRYLRYRFLRKMESRLSEYGLYLIVIAALTPIPFSGVAMLIGSVRYSVYRYIVYSLTRFVRFAAYAWIFLEASIYF